MQKLAEICIRRPIFAAMIIMALVVVGAASYFRLQVDRNPKVDLPTVTVRTNLPGASPEEIETEISQVMEEQVNTVEGISELRSFAQPGNSNVMITFNLDRPIETATQDVRDRVAVALRFLPIDAQPPIVSKFDSDNSPSLSIALYGNRPIRELTELADKIVKIQLERAEGVGEVRINGGLLRAVNVWIDAERLAAYQIPINAVRDALVRQNADVPGGNVTGDRTEATLRTMGRMVDPRAFNDIVVSMINGQPIKLSDLGYVEDGTKEQRSVARLDGTPTVTLEVRRQSGANTVAVIEAAKAALNKAAPLLPPDVQMKIVEDQSGFIYAALHEINLHLIVGGILASLVVFMFMRSWQAMVIAAVAIPCSLISTFGAMWALGFTMNSVTMLALVLMVGIVIDDALVVLENIFRFIEEKHMGPFEAARAATADIGHAVLATTLSLVVIFVPVSFMSSIAGRFLYQFGITAAVAVLVSLLVSFTLTPMMGARLLRAEAAGHEIAKSRRGFYRYIDRTYTFVLRHALNNRVAVAAVAITVIIAMIPMYRLLRQDFFPANIDDGAFSVNYTFIEGMSVAAKDVNTKKIEDEIRTIPGVQLVLGSTGQGPGGGGGGMGDARTFIQLKPHEERVFSLTRLIKGLLHGQPGEAFKGNFHQRDIMNIVRQKVRKYRDVRAQVTNVQTINLGGGNVDISFALKGPDLQQLFNYAENLRSRSEELGITDASVSLQLNKPELQVVIDRERAADLGVDTQMIASALRFMVGGDEQVSRFHDPAVNDDYDVQLRLLEEFRNTRENIERLYVPSRSGKLVRLDNLVNIVEAKAPSRIERLDRQRQVSIRASVAQGYGLADRIEALKAATAAFHMPPGYTYVVAGRARELERTFTEFLWAFLLSVIFMYMILASLFESLTHPLTILLSLPLSIPFALFSLYATGNSLNLYSALGILVLFGVVKKNAILQVDHTNNLRAKGMARFEALMQANRDRLRPILMTNFALVGGMLPLAVGTGPGSEERRAVAIVVIGGQLLSLVLTLVVTPVAYSLMDDFTVAIRRILRRPVPATPHRDPVPQGEPVGAQHFFKGEGD